ncbi:Branched-chain-amino-acid aminotransferase [Pyrenophora tritici-repentis]|nr:Branched-chain-amino-acid aminotransferase [Pyrenophora tritici-repentis]
MQSKGDKFTYKEAEQEPGPVCKKLLTTLKGIQQGKIEDQKKWLHKVERPAQFGKHNQANGANIVGQLP